MNEVDLSFYTDPPKLSHTGQLELTVLAPLSMVDRQPGTYFLGRNHPTRHMVMGALENALGWHFAEDFRKSLLKSLAKKAKKLHRKRADYKDHPWLSGKAANDSGSGYFSLLQYHLDVEHISSPEVQSYDDLWSMHLHDKGINYIGGSRNYDYRLEDFISHLRNKPDKKDEQLNVDDRKGYDFIKLEDVYSVRRGQVHTKSIRPAFPQYYVSPKKRGYVVPNESYVANIRLTESLARIFDRQLNQPAAPVYLGHSEGWVDLIWKHHV